MKALIRGLVFVALAFLGSLLFWKMYDGIKWLVARELDRPVYGILFIVIGVVVVVRCVRSWTR